MFSSGPDEFWNMATAAGVPDANVAKLQTRVLDCRVSLRSYRAIRLRLPNKEIRGDGR